MPPRPGYVRPSKEFHSKSKELAVEFCRELTKRGLQRKIGVPGSPLEPNTFRTRIALATRTLPVLYRVRYRDCTKDAEIPAADRMRKPFPQPIPKAKKAPAESVPCTNAKVGCPRSRVYLDGYCKRCHDRRAYWSDAELRERKRAQASVNAKARRAARRERKAAERRAAA